MAGSVNSPVAGTAQGWGAALISAVATGRGFGIRQVVILCLLSTQKASPSEGENSGASRKAPRPA